MAYADEIHRRRTFAIISHPDAGKTTLTEKLLLFGGAIQLAGAVKARRASRHAASDFIAIEQQRGISVSTAVMSFAYQGCALNLLDTPGHEDFSEDTYRVLTAVDSALMVLDSAKGVEIRTEKLMDVCRLRDTPVMTFANKLDREALDPFELIHNVEEKLSIICAPVTWPIGMGQSFRGVYHRGRNEVVFYERGERDRQNPRLVLEGLDDPRLEHELGARQADKLREDLELLDATEPFDREAFLHGLQTPVFFGSAISNFGVQELLDAFVAQAPSPQPRAAHERTVDPEEADLTGFVFKIQANLDPRHRDRMAFLRITSGRYQRGMKLYHVRAGREMAVNNARVFLASDRVITEEAYAGDIIGLPNHGTIRIGDTFTCGEPLSFTGVPSFAPELFRRATLMDPLRSKALLKGLQQLCEEGAATLFRPLEGAELVIGAVGPLQFDVIRSRLVNEYNVRARFEAVSLQVARWIDSDDPDALEAFVKRQRHRIYRDITGNLAYLADGPWALDYAAQQNPAIRFSATIETVSPG